MTLANPRQIIKDYKPKTVAILPQLEDNYETDPAKLGDTTTLTGSLGGLFKAGVNGLANMGARTYNAITSYTPSQASAAEFGDRNLQRFAPQKPASAPIGARSLKMLPSHTPGQVITPAAPPAAPQEDLTAFTASLPRPDISAPKRGVRRAVTVALSAPDFGQPENDPPQDQAPAAPAFGVTRLTDAENNPAVTAERMAQVGVNSGGFGFTRNEDGTIGQMLSLRSNSAAPAEQPLPATAYTPPARLRAGDVGYTGSQAEWEDDQSAGKLYSRPFGFKAAAAMLAQRQQAETEANNLRTLGVRQQEADTNSLYHGTLAKAVDAKLPGDVAKQKSDLLNDMVNRGLITAKTMGEYLDNQEKPLNAVAERDLKAAQGFGIRTGANVSLAELPFKQALITSEVGKNQSVIANNPTKLEIAQEKNATALQLAKEKQEAPVREAALAAAQTAGVDVDTALLALKAGYTPKKKTLFRKAGFYDAQGNRVDPSKLTGATAQVAPKGTQAKVGGKIVTSDGSGGWY